MLRQGRPVIIYDSLARPGSERNLRWLRAHARLTCAGRDRGCARDIPAARRGRGSRHGVSSRLAGRRNHQPRRSGRGFRDQRRAPPSNCSKCCGTGAARRGLIFTSTNKVYGAIDDVDLVERDSRYVPAGALAGTGIAETRPLQFHSPYGCSKGAADQYVLDYARSYGLATAVLRMSCIYGPHQHGTEDQGWVAHFLIRAMQGRTITIYGDGKQVRDLLFVDDLVGALTARRALPARDRRSGLQYRRRADNTVSLLELIAQIAALHGGPPQVEFGDWRVGDQRWYVSDSAKFGRAPGGGPQVGVAGGHPALCMTGCSSAGARRQSLQAAQ